MTYAVLTSFLSTANADPTTVTVSGATSGRLLLGFVWADDVYGSNGPADDYSIANWTKLSGNVGWVAGGAYWRVATGTASDNMSINFSAAHSAGAHVIQFDDADTTNPIDVLIATTPASATTVAFTAGGSTTQANEYAFAFAASYGDSAAWTTGSASWTNGFADVGAQPQQFTSGDGDNAWLGAKTLTATETLSTTLTVGSGGSETTNPIAVLVSVKQQGAAADPVRRSALVHPSAAVIRSAVW